MCRFWFEFLVFLSRYRVAHVPMQRESVLLEVHASH
jgi:hypothetical protein